MNEKKFEDILCKFPELIEDGLTFKDRQVIIKGKRVDILFVDRHEQKLIVEIKKGAIRREHIAQLLDYEGEFLTPDDPNIRVMLVGNRVPENLRRSLDHHGFEWKEIAVMSLINFLKEKGDEKLMVDIEIEDIYLSGKFNMAYSQRTTPSVKSNISKEGKMKETMKEGLSYENMQRHRFMQQLLERSREKTSLFRNVSHHSKQNWVSTTAGKYGLQWQFTAMKDFARVEFWFCTKDAGINLRRYEFVKKHKVDIENIFMDPLKWDFDEHRINQGIRYFCKIGGFQNESDWRIIQDDMIDHLLKMQSALGEIIKSLE